jgi:hypothetical protein
MFKKSKLYNKRPSNWKQSMLCYQAQKGIGAGLK